MARSKPIARTVTGHNPREFRRQRAALNPRSPLYRHRAPTRSHCLDCPRLTRCFDTEVKGGAAVVCTYPVYDEIVKGLGFTL